MHAGTPKYRQQVLVRRFKAAKATFSTDVKGLREQGCVCKSQTATRDTITFTCPFWTQALPKPFNYLAWSAKGTKALCKVTVFLFHAIKEGVLLLLVFLSVGFLSVLLSS